MQDHDWNDLKYALALWRLRTFSAASRVCRVSETTVSRRIAALEHRLGISLFSRDGGGRIEATQAGQRILEEAEIVERANLRIAELAGNQNAAVTGTVRISAVPIIANRVLVRNLPLLQVAHPGLRTELVPESRNLDLTRREADIAVRFARPSAGGLQILAKRVGSLQFALFGSAAARENAGSDPCYVTYEGGHGGLPQARWLQTVVSDPSAQRCVLQVADAETALEAAATGLGMTLLPVLAADGDARLRRRAPSARSPKLPLRDVWMLWHRDIGQRAAVNAVKSWIEAIDWR